MSGSPSVIRYRGAGFPVFGNARDEGRVSERTLGQPDAHEDEFDVDAESKARPAKVALKHVLAGWAVPEWRDFQTDVELRFRAPAHAAGRNLPPVSNKGLIRIPAPVSPQFIGAFGDAAVVRHREGITVYGSDGAIRARFPLLALTSGGAVGPNGQVYVARVGGNERWPTDILRLDLRTGDFDSVASIPTAMTVAAGRASPCRPYFLARDDGGFQVSMGPTVWRFRRDGRLVWNRTLPPERKNALGIWPGPSGMTLVNCSEGGITALGDEDGESAWNYDDAETASVDVDGTLWVPVGSEVHHVSSEGKRISAFEASAASAAPYPVRAVVPDEGDRLLVFCGGIRKMTPSGELVWEDTKCLSNAIRVPGNPGSLYYSRSERAGPWSIESPLFHLDASGKRRRVHLDVASERRWELRPQLVTSDGALFATGANAAGDAPALLIFKPE